MSIFGTTDTPVLDFGDVSSWFESHSGQPYSHLGRGVHDLLFQKFISDVTPFIGGSKGDTNGACPPPTDQNFLNCIQFFWKFW